jgi:uncharacterized small protein (DUF1192 family)
MKRTSNGSTTAQTENKNRVNNRSSRKVGTTQTQVSASDAPKSVKVEDLEARLAEYNETLSKAKKQSAKFNETLSKAKDAVQNQVYVVATQRIANGTGSAEDEQIVASRKASINAEKGLEKFFSKEFKDSDEVTKAWDDLAPELGSVTSAIAETIRLWNKGFNALYQSIGITNKKMVTPALLKGLCPFLQVASADGLKAAAPGRRAVRKNGKAVKKGGKRVYKYTLRAINGWSAKSLFKTLQVNYRMTSESIFSEDELNARMALLNSEVSALKALKKAKEEAKSDNKVVAAEAEVRMEALKQAAKAAGRKTKENTATISSEETKKVVNG